MDNRVFLLVPALVVFVSFGDAKAAKLHAALGDGDGAGGLQHVRERWVFVLPLPVEEVSGRPFFRHPRVRG